MSPAESPGCGLAFALCLGFGSGLGLGSSLRFSSSRSSSSSANSLAVAALSGVLGSLIWQELLAWARAKAHARERPLRLWQYMLRALPARLSADHGLEELHLHGSRPSMAEGDIARNQMPLPPVHYVLRPEADPRLDQALYVRYDPDVSRKTGAIIIVIPGGNYDESDVFCGEGQPVAQWLISLGITAVVLQYRCVSRGHYWPAQFQDWLDCARAVKRQASSWGCDPDRIGVIGFSAGGHLASYAALRARSEVKPKLQILVYPAIDTFTPREDGDIDPWYADEGYPPHEASTHYLVDDKAPPAFLAGITTDGYCPSSENTDVYARELAKHGVAYEYALHTEDEHGHGCGVQDWWSTSCEAWLCKQGWAHAQALSSVAEEEPQEEQDEVKEEEANEDEIQEDEIRPAGENARKKRRRGRKKPKAHPEADNSET